MDFERIIEDVALRNGIRVHYVDRGEEWGRAALGTKQVFIPRPTGFVPFFTGLHEIGHIASGHNSRDGKPEYVWEYEAFTWALEFCKNRNIPIPEETVNNERDIIAEKVREEVKHGTRRLDPEIVKFVKKGSDDNHDVEFVRRHVADDGTVSQSR